MVLGMYLRNTVNLEELLPFRINDQPIIKICAHKNAFFYANKLATKNSKQIKPWIEQKSAIYFQNVSSLSCVSFFTVYSKSHI